jgi:hypothetical protein
MTLSRRHFVEFADFMVSLWTRNKSLTNTIIKDIDLKFDDITTLDIPSCKSLYIDEIIEKRLLEHYNNIGKDIQLILDKNSLRFNKHMFKNYIIAKSEQNDTKIKLINP